MAGRTNKYETHIKPYINLIKSMRMDGHTEENIYKHLDVSHTTWEKYKHDKVELIEALKISKEVLVADLEQTLFQQAKSGNTTALIFALKNLAPKKWGEKVNVDASVKGDKFIEAMERFVSKL